MFWHLWSDGGGASPVPRPQLPSAVPYFSLSLAPQSRQIRWVFCLSSMRALWTICLSHRALPVDVAYAFIRALGPTSLRTSRRELASVPGARCAPIRRFHRHTLSHGSGVLLAGMVGLEPTNAGVKVPCLTTWLHPNTKEAADTRRSFISRYCTCSETR